MHILKQLASNALASIICIAAVLALTAGPVSAAHDTQLTITKATWNAKRELLTIEGQAEIGFAVVASNAADTGQILGSDTPANKARYKIEVPGPITPFPCRVHVEQDDGAGLAIAEADVSNPPDECTAPNNPPLCTIDTPPGDRAVLLGDSLNYTGTATDADGTVETFSWTFGGGTPASSDVEDPGLVTYNTVGSYTTTFDATDNDGATCQPPATITVTVNDPNAPPTALPNQLDYKFMMNYELGMHCTGFEFAYCCVLPAYNSILAQVVKPQNGVDWPKVLEADPNDPGVDPGNPVTGGLLDVLGRETVMRDYELDENGNFAKYVVKYWHDAQPRNDGNGKGQATTLISAVEGASLLAWNTIVDAAAKNPDGSLVTGSYAGATNVVLGDGSLKTTGGTFGAPVDNYQNAVWNHLYIYADTEGTRLCANDTGVTCHEDADCAGVGGVCGDSTEANKLRLGLDVDYPTNVGPAGHPMGPVGSPLNNVLTFSEDTGTVVYTQMKVVENLPITLTSPRIWEALGLPLTPFEDTIDFFGDPGLVDEDSIRPYVAMKAQLHHYDPVNGPGDVVLNSAGDPVIGFGTAPIDIPNCERCHSAFNQIVDGVPTAPNSPNLLGTPEASLVQLEIDFWKAYYPGLATGADWYARLKGAAISILSVHDTEHGTNFTEYYPAVACDDPGNCDGGPLTAPVAGSVGALLASEDPSDPRLAIPQNTRLGFESVICQKCHADNVIAVVKSANCGTGSLCEETPADELFSNIAPVAADGSGHLIPPLTEAIHYNHRELSEGGVINFQDSLGRSGGCQGCHPAHRSDGDMAGYPIDLDGNNFYANSDNRDANGGCFVGRDVHSNPTKDIDGAETPSHLNAVGQWMQANVANDTPNDGWKGIWCTNCHSQASQQIWKAENVADLINGRGACSNDPEVFCSVDAECALGTCELNNVREAGPNLSDVVTAVNDALGTPSVTLAQFESWLDPKGKQCAGGDTPGAACYGDGDCGGGGTCVGLSADGIDYTSAIWNPDPGMCDHVASLFGAEPSPYQDGNVATIEVAVGSTDGTECSTGGGAPGPDCNDDNNPDFFICLSADGDGDPSVNILDFCTTKDCVAAAQATLANSAAVPVPMSAATDGRDHWLAPGEPHCADCHAAPYVEQSGNINAFAPFNYPRKASLMRYSRGHSDITCQGCHESIHGLYPVTPTIDTTSYAQAASLNDDDTHGPLKCGTCHDVDQLGVPTWTRDLEYKGQPIKTDFDAAVSWMHTYTDEASPLAPGGVCENCHGVKGNNWDVVGPTNKNWVQHAYRGRVSRTSMDKVEIEVNGYVSGDPDDPGQAPAVDTVCQECHRDRTSKLSCSSTKWKNHLLEGRVAEKVWLHVTETVLGVPGESCGW